MVLNSLLDPRTVVGLKEGEHWVLIPETATHTEGWYLTKEGEALARAFLRQRYPKKRLAYDRLGLEEW